MSELKRVTKQNLVDNVFNQLLDKINKGEWPENTMIPSENELRETFSVSRDTVREAIKRLSALGLLKSVQGKGTYVQKMDISFYMNILVPSLFITEDNGMSLIGFMKAIQVECTRQAAALATEADFEELEGCLARMKTAEDYPKFFGHDNDYHCCLSRITGNELFIKSMDIASSLLHVYLTEIVEYHGSERSIDQHERCLRALEARDTENAVRIMTEHYDMLTERLSNWLKKKEEAAE